MGDCIVKEKLNGEHIVITCRLEKDQVVRVDDLRATKRPIPTRMDMLREVLMVGLEVLEKGNK